MRKPRDFDTELQALTDKAKALKTKKQGQLGELVVATGADGLSIEQLAGALLDASRAPTATLSVAGQQTTPPCGQCGVNIGQ